MSMRKLARRVVVLAWLAAYRGGRILVVAALFLLAPLAVLLAMPESHPELPRFLVPATTVALEEAGDHAKGGAAALEVDVPEGGPVPPLAQPSSSTPVQLVVSSYRDGVRCARTLAFAMEKAAHPDRIHFRVMQALEPGGISCAEAFAEGLLDGHCRQPPDPMACKHRVLRRLRAWTIPLEMAAGPARQRGLLNEVRDFQDHQVFCINTDSHMDFHRRWDEFMLGEWSRLNNEFAVLTAYPMPMGVNHEQSFANVHVDLCGFQMEERIPRGLTAAQLPTAPGDKPYLTMNWAAGFSFSRCHADRNVPVDKHLQWIFTGEEVDRAVRLWTHGYDLYLPVHTMIYHNYTAAKQEFWQKYVPQKQGVLMLKSRDRITSKMRLEENGRETPVDLGIYTLGSQRSLEQYVEWSRMDLGTSFWRRFLRSKGLTPVTNASRADGPHDYCQKLKRVPVRDSRELLASIFSGGLSELATRFVPAWGEVQTGTLQIMALNESSGL